MPNIPPLANCPGTPTLVPLPAGTYFRVHSDRYASHAFNDTPQPPPLAGGVVRGGRFDTDDGSYAYLYAADRERGAFAESFGRNLDYTRTGPRPLPRARVKDKKVSTIDVPELQLVDIDGGGAQQLGQDDWLTHCDEWGYPVCREWARAIRKWAPAAQGMRWHSKRDSPELVFVLWGNPASASTGCGLTHPGTNSEYLLGTPAQARLEDFLHAWRMYLEP
jgi:RES domain